MKKTIVFLSLICLHSSALASETFSADVWADNWFELRINGQQVAEDSVPITTERSFNAESFEFEADRPFVIGLVAKDFIENDTGLEYIGSRRQQMGDGGVILQIKDDTGQTIVVSNDQWQCSVIHNAPLDKSCENETNPIAGEGACGFEKTDEPVGWDKEGFDTSSWSKATIYSERDVSPKGGYDQIDWDNDAKFIWGPDLEQSNTVLCRITISNESDQAHTHSDDSSYTQDNCDAVKASVSDAGFDDRVSVSCTESHATIQSDTYPNHLMMTGIIGTNEQVPVPAEYNAPIILSPMLSDTPLTRDAALGVAINGVPIYDYTAGGEMNQEDLAHHQARHDTFQTGQLDECGGHAGRGDDYHYHVKPTCMIEQMANAGDDAIIGWAFDGFPIYGNNNPDGSLISDGDLDICNGQLDEKYGYRYHTSENSPYIIQCLMGIVNNFDRLPRVPPLSAADGQGAEPGRPPKGGVENLVFSDNEDGARSMDYSYQGEEYYIRYRPSVNVGCYDFVTKTITNNGEIHEQEYCRKSR